MILSTDEIKAIVSHPSKLPPSSSGDDYEMERYQRVAIEQAAVLMADMNQPCPPLGPSCNRDTNGRADCRACWREYLEGECAAVEGE